MNRLHHIPICAALVLSSYMPTALAEEPTTEIEKVATVAEEVVVDVPSAIKGKATFDTICSHCHNITYEESRIGAPGLQGVLERHDEAWINEWLQGPETFSKTNEAAKNLIESNKFGLAMPTLPAMKDDKVRADIIAYLKTLK